MESVPSISGRRPFLTDEAIPVDWPQRMMGMAVDMLDWVTENGDI